MGRIREAINARRPRDAVSAPTFGEPAGEAAIAAAEARDFPARRFVVRFPEQDCHSLLDYEVTFCQAPGT